MRRFNPFSALVLFSSGALALSGCGAGGVPAKATISTIDRTCDIISTRTETVEDPSGQKRVVAQEKNRRKGECRSVGEWEEVRTKKTEKVQGTAIVHVDYQAPQDGSHHSSSLQFDGLDDEFYDLKAGDQIEIMVAKDDPTRIWKA